MASDDNNKSGQFDASLQLPDEGNKSEEANPAAELIRKKVEAAYAKEPDAKEEIVEVTATVGPAQRSKHQQFIYELTNSGRPLHEVQTAWHEYYAGLTDAEKHEVWQEFYSAHSQLAQHPALSRAEPKPEPIKAVAKRARQKMADKVPAKAIQRRPRTRRIPASKHRQASPARSLLFGLGIGGITILIFLFGFFNERIIAPFIQPSRNTQNIPIIIGGSSGSTAVGPAPEIIVPKINIEVPVVYGVTSTDPDTVENALNIGVVHYADTAQPGQNGNLVIVGHSSGNIFNPGHYKYAFSLLHELSNGDVFYLQKDSKRYTYQIYKKEIVKPTDVGVLGPQNHVATATLITCDPPGLSINRLVLVGKQINPSPTKNTRQTSSNLAATKNTAILPSASPTLWSRFVHWFTE
ncbi:MAG TPA: class D sortase [Candidatus Saccharimonadales bacterium]|nr:class D sortase [Candidatus Saccharimonadales bacterium]